MARKPADQSVNREDIILAAADVLARNGYEATTMKDIAAQVNLTAASLYHHFRNKDALLLAVLEVGLDYVIELLEPITQSPLSCTEKLTQMITQHVISVTRNTSVGAAMIFEIRSLMALRTLSYNGGALDTDTGEAFARRRDEFFARRDYFEELFRSVIRDGIQKGVFRPVDVGIFVKTMLGANNWVAVWYKDGGRLDGETVARMIAENFLQGVKA